MEDDQRIVLVEVTADDIKQGQRDNCLDCPVARALNRAFNLGPACVDTDIFYFDWGYDTHSLPEEVTEFIVNFDDGQQVEPFSFVVDVGPYDFFPAGHLRGECK